LFAHTRLPIVSGPLMPCWETICIDFVYDARLHLTFLFDRFQCLMFFTNLHFSSIIQRSCMMENKCNSCWWIVSLFASHQYCFCVVKKLVGNVYNTRSIQKEMLLKRFALLNVDHVQTSMLQYGYPFFVLLWMTIQFGDDKMFCFSQCCSHANPNL